MSGGLVYIRDRSDKNHDVSPYRPPENHNIIKPSHAKSVIALEHSVGQFVKVYGIDWVGVCTLTFPRPVRDHEEAQRRFNNAKRWLLPELFPEVIAVKERHGNGGWHYHLLVSCKGDIRTGFDAESYREAKRLNSNLQLHKVPKTYRGSRGRMAIAATEEEQAKALMRYVYDNAPPLLLEILAELKERLPRLGFGRFDFAPVYSNAEAVARYFSKGYRNSIERRAPRDRNVRLVSYTSGARFANTRFGSVTGGRPYRRGKELLGEYLTRRDMPVTDVCDLSRWLGPRWGYWLGSFLPNIEEHGGVPPGVIESTVRRLVKECPLRD